MCDRHYPLLIILKLSAGYLETPIYDAVRCSLLALGNQDSCLYITLWLSLKQDKVCIGLIKQEVEVYVPYHITFAIRTFL